METYELSLPLLELLARASLVYFAVALALRLVPKRAIGGISPSDLLALIVVGGLITDGMSTGSETTMDFIVLAGTVLAWDWLINKLEFKSSLFTRLTVESPVVIVREGEMLRRAMRRELITEQELLSQLRLNGVEKPEDAALVTVEPNGCISVIPNASAR